MSAYALFKQLQRLRKSIRQQQYTMIKRGTDALCHGYTDFFKEINGKYYNAPRQNVRMEYLPRRNKSMCYKFWFDMHPTATLKQALRSFREDLDFYIFISRFRPNEFVKLIPDILCANIVSVGYCGNYGIKTLRYICRNYKGLILPIKKKNFEPYDKQGWIDGKEMGQYIRKNLEYLMKHGVIILPRDLFIIRGLILYDMDDETSVLDFEFAKWGSQFMNIKEKVRIFGYMCASISDNRFESEYEEIKEFNRHYQII